MPVEQKDKVSNIKHKKSYVQKKINKNDTKHYVSINRDINITSSMKTVMFINKKTKKTPDNKHHGCI